MYNEEKNYKMGRNDNTPRDDVIYWRIYLSRKSELLSIVTMQYFDEYDYDQDRFVMDEEGLNYVFLTLGDARNFLVKNFEPSDVNPSHRHLFKLTKLVVPRN